MPRPKSELTKNRRYVGLYLTPDQHKEWKRLGAQVFARALLDASIEQNKTTQQEKKEPN